MLARPHNLWQPGEDKHGRLSNLLSCQVATNLTLLVPPGCWKDSVQQLGMQPLSVAQAVLRNRLKSPILATGVAKCANMVAMNLNREGQPMKRIAPSLHPLRHHSSFHTARGLILGRHMQTASSWFLPTGAASSWSSGKGLHQLFDTGTGLARDLRRLLSWLGLVLVSYGTWHPSARCVRTIQPKHASETGTSDSIRARGQLWAGVTKASAWCSTSSAE